MATSRIGLTPSGARRQGDDYQDLVALEFLIDWLEHEDRYKWIKVEADRAGFLDDVVALMSDGTVIGRQVKYATDPDMPGDSLTWETLFSIKTTKSKSLLQKWAMSLPQLEALGSLHDASVVSSRRAAPELDQAMIAGSRGVIDFDKIADATVRGVIISQLGDEASARSFLSKFKFRLNQPTLRELEEGLWKRFERIGGTETGWHALRHELSNWVYYRNEPAPRGEITLEDVKRAAHWDQTTGALSIVPLTDRPLIDLPLIGRQADLDWLNDASGDHILWGAPGCGKTFLLREYTKGEGRYFVVDYDRSRLLTALRARRPSAVIVDDAHLRPEVLTMLRQLRTETGLSFDIVASCWPGGRSHVMRALTVGEAAGYELPLLIRDEIASVIRTAGLAGPDPLIQEIVEQAEGRPGLAVTLVQLCLQNGVREVALGDALSRSVETTFEPLVGGRSTELLAAFAVGGDKGMKMDVVADLLRLTSVEVRHKIAGLAAGGVVFEASEQHLSVRPRGLRDALVRDVFFNGGYSLSIDPFFAAVPDRYEAVRTLLLVRHRGGAVSDDLLLPYLEAYKNRRLWNLYASIGPKECSVVLRKHPELASDIAEAALEYVPSEAFPLLLDAAARDHRPLNSNPGHPLRQIQAWIQSFRPGAVARRRLLAHNVRTWITDGGASDIGTQVLAYALSPTLEQSGLQPGGGHTFVIRRGVLTEQDMREISGVWSAALETFSSVQDVHWDSLLSAVEAWAYPQRAGIDEDAAEVYALMRSQAGQMTSDLVPLATRHPGIVENLKQIRTRLGLETAAAEDATFSTLFPGRSRSDFREAEERQKSAVADLAQRWKDLPPGDVAAMLVRYENEAQVANHRWPRLTRYLCQLIAEQTDDLDGWISALEEAGAPTDLGAEFLSRAVAEKSKGWEGLLDRELQRPELRYYAVHEILKLEGPPQPLLDKAWPLLADQLNLVETLCLRNEVPGDTLAELLRHPSKAVQGAVAVGIWSSDPQGRVPDDLYNEWRATVVASSRKRNIEGYWLGEILKSDRSLACDWLKECILGNADAYPLLDDTLAPVLVSLRTEDRIALLPDVGDGVGSGEMIAALVGHDVEAYKSLLSIDTLKDYHLDPLGYSERMVSTDMGARQPRSEAVPTEMLVLALDKGYSTREIVGALQPSMWSWVGKTSNMWLGWLDLYKDAESHADHRVREVAHLWREYMTEQWEKSLAEERHEDIYGRGA